jgi:hypothetical protein
MASSDRVRFINDTLLYAFTGLLFVVACIVALVLNGTNGGGDSIGHYLLAHHAWKYPNLFFNHWGKPVFTMLSSPFAQFGFKGVKLFNVFVTFGAVLCTIALVKSYFSKYAVWVLPIYFCAPEGIGVIFSGLTEPLFALLFGLTLWLIHRQKNLLAILIASFLPLSRSEGLIILIVIGVYMLLNRKYSLLPFMLFGQLIITLLGYSVYHDPLWVFTKIPYAHQNALYGSGPFMHYLQSMPHVFGIVSTVLLYVGCCIYIIRSIRQLISSAWYEVLSDVRFIIYGSFIAFTLAHSVFYALGTFNDIGLTRVFIAVFPAMVFISVESVCYIHSFTKKFTVVRNLSAYLTSIAFCAMIYFCYVGSLYSIPYARVFMQDHSQQLINSHVVPYLKKHYNNYTYYFSDNNIAMYASYDKYKKGEYSSEISALKPGLNIGENEIIIWDNWFSVIEEHITRDEMVHKSNLKVDTTFTATSHKGNLIEFIVLKRNDNALR